MECLVLILTLVFLTVLISIYSNLNHIRKETKKIMSKQEEFNAKVAAINEAITGLGNKIAEEGQQVRDFIAALPPEVDTSALDGVAERLTALSAGVSEIFVEQVADDEDDETTAVEEAEEPTTEPPAEGGGD